MCATDAHDVRPAAAVLPSGLCVPDRALLLRALLLRALSDRALSDRALSLRALAGDCPRSTLLAAAVPRPVNTPADAAPATHASSATETPAMTTSLRLPPSPRGWIASPGRAAARRLAGQRMAVSSGLSLLRGRDSSRRLTQCLLCNACYDPGDSCQRRSSDVATQKKADYDERRPGSGSASRVVCNCKHHGAKLKS